MRWKNTVLAVLVAAVSAGLWATPATAASVMAAPVAASPMPASAMPASVMAEEGDVTWTVRTASNSLGADRSSYSYAINPGATVSDAMVVANRGTDALSLTVYAADGFTTGEGGLDLRNRDVAQTGIGVWATAPAASVTVAPGQTVDVPFTVAVPANATPGDYVGGIVTSLTRPDASQQVNVERRLGIRIKLRVGGALAPALAVSDLSVSYDGSWNPFAGGTATVSYTIRNTGNTTLSATQAASVAGPFGWWRSDAGDIAAPPELLPGESWPVTVPVADVPAALLLTGTATLTPLVVDPSGSRSMLEPVSADATAWAVPWLLLLLILVLIALVVLALRLRRRRRAREDARVAKAVQEALAAK
ncbi:hypothetical protein J2S43_001347 [Catenuloplanes nepalensis]|uniref:DUF916 domain-containing protein n=1 Tax=Catenuloplanes nepalensis TaxID=587533 RepID=A0ABT9MN69_9ACTN|nr:DUF916 domain-containing protein [Catenuloplanes nepalensis]MDP9792835.1 hypothetical protein [Catenuloplanes nepalensis]